MRDKFRPIGVILRLGGVLLCLFHQGYSQAKVGTTGLQFLKVGVGARAVGMGEAFTAVASDASALYYNPGGLIQLKSSEAIFTLIDWPAGIRFTYLGGIYPLPQLSGVAGVQITSLFTDDMIETTPEMPYGTGRTFTSGDLSLALTYCQRLTDKFSVGTTLKYLHERLADQSATGWAADVGTFYETGWKRVNIGMLIQNFGPDMKFVKEPFPLPITFKFGMSVVPYQSGAHTITVAGEFLHPNDNLELYRLGAEYRFHRLVALRIGKQINGWRRDKWDDYVRNREKNDPFIEYPLIDEKGNLTTDGVSMGLGLDVVQAGITVDYAWMGMGTLGAAHRFTIGYKIPFLSR
ncbi:MAG: PorV/PorQ family protein [bacterium]